MRWSAAQRAQTLHLKKKTKRPFLQRRPCCCHGERAALTPQRLNYPFVTSLHTYTVLDGRLARAFTSSRTSASLLRMSSCRPWNEGTLRDKGEKAQSMVSVTHLQYVDYQNVCEFARFWTEQEKLRRAWFKLTLLRVCLCDWSAAQLAVNFFHAKSL